MSGRSAVCGGPAGGVEFRRRRPAISAILTAKDHESRLTITAISRSRTTC